MAYFGIQEIVDSYTVTVKLHGPLDTIEIEPSKLREFIKQYSKPPKVARNLVDYVNNLSHGLVDQYCNGNTLVWAEVEIKSPTGLIYSSSAEKVLANVKS